MIAVQALGMVRNGPAFSWMLIGEARTHQGMKVTWLSDK